MVNTLYQRIRELSVFSNAFERIPMELMSIHKECDILQANKNLISSIKSQLEECPRNAKTKSFSSSPNLFTEKKISSLDVLEAIHNDSDSSKDSNSNYDFELDTAEAKNLWKKHMNGNSCFNQNEDRVKLAQRNPFKHTLSKIEQEDDHYEDIEIYYEDGKAHRNEPELKTKVHSM